MRFHHHMQHCSPTSRKRPRTIAGRRATELRLQLGQPFRTLRTDAGLSLRQVAEAAGLSSSFIRQVEAGEREASVSALAAMGSALGADLDPALSEHRPTDP
jgi:transcriptional regulator with XRE-family HTH domain